MMLEMFLKDLNDMARIVDNYINSFCDCANEQPPETFEMIVIQDYI